MYVESNDNFRLDESAITFGQKAKTAGLPIRVEVIEGADHFSVNTEERNRTIQTEMDARIR